jgi:16S rRNA (cytosine967-C5)-methyltransferase
LKTTARSVALEALAAGGDAAEHLDRALRAASIDARDRAFATELAYGTLKMRRSLEWAISRYLTRPLAQTDATVRWILLLGAYQLLYLDRVPAHSAVDESVELARSLGATSSTGFVNAILRKVAAELPRPPKPKDDDGAPGLGLYASLPDWIAKLLIERFGHAQATLAAEGMNGPPRRALRFASSQRSIDDFARAARDEGAKMSPGRYGIPECIVVDATGDSATVRDAIAAGDAAWQSEESQLAVQLLDPKPGETVLDVCAGRGGKTMMIAGRVGATGAVWSIDDDRVRLESLTASVLRAGVTHVHAVRCDARDAYPAQIPAQVDAALVDAPCSGLGVLGRQADARWRKRETDPARFAVVQLAILDRAASRVRPGGRLLYATCSIVPAEDEGVVDTFLASHDEWRAEPLVLPHARGMMREGAYALTVPGIDGADGFYYAVLHRRRPAAAAAETQGT